MLSATPPTTVPGGSMPAGPEPFVHRLLAPGPQPWEGANRDLYNMLVGSWDAVVVDRQPGGEIRQSAEIHATWALNGRAIQDLWIVPGIGDPHVEAGGPVRYGTTLRIYDPKKDRWNVTWFNPVTGAENHLEGRWENGEIMQTGTGPQGVPVRWVFDRLRGEAFHWRGERLSEDGRTWIADTEFLALRATPGPSKAGTPTQRQVTWNWTDRLGIERVSLREEGGQWVASGRIFVLHDRAPVLATYQLTHGPDHRFREARIEVETGAGSKVLTLRRRGDGQWEADGVVRKDLAGCEEVDLMWSPYSNTPPLMAQPLAPGEHRELKVAWVRFPDLEVRSLRQAYTRLPGQAPFRYRYENLESGFQGELSLDEAGLVVDYGSWRRR